VIGSVVASYLVALGLLGGIVAERIRFDRERRAAVARFETATQRLRAEMITAEHVVTWRRAER